MQYDKRNIKTSAQNESMHSEMGPVRQNTIQTSRVVVVVVIVVVVVVVVVVIVVVVVVVVCSNNVITNICAEMRRQQLKLIFRPIQILPKSIHLETQHQSIEYESSSVTKHVFYISLTFARIFMTFDRYLLDR